MNLRKRKIFADNISVVEILQIFWKDKILIVIISLAFFIFFGLFAKHYSNIIKNREKLVDINVTIQNNQNDLNLYYENILKYYGRVYDFKNLNFKIFHYDISGFFLENIKKFNDFKIYFEKLNISSDNYFNKNYKTDKKNFFTLLLPENKKLEGELFLKEYIIWLFNQSQIRFINDLKKIILHELMFLKKNKEFLNNFEITLKNKYSYEPFCSVYEFKFFNPEYINQRILFSEKIISHLDSYVYDYTPIIEFKSEVIPKIYINSTINLSVVGLIFGFFLSLIIIFFKNMKKKIN